MPTFLDNHRGPFRFCVVRPAKKAGFFRSEWLTSTTDREDVESEARALLDDPRDTITSIQVWSEREQVFVGGFKK